MKFKITYDHALSLAERHNADSVPVTNFLCTLPENTSQMQDMTNLKYDQILYGWDDKIFHAIRQGIHEAFQPWPKVE